jgi:hypothetical protein
MVRNRKGPAGATARAQYDVDSADEQIKSQHGAPHDPAQGTLWECICQPLDPCEDGAAARSAPRAKRKPKDAGQCDAQPFTLLDFMAHAATRESHTDTVDNAGEDLGVGYATKHGCERPRAGVRSRPEPAVVEPIASHRLAREPWVWTEALLASSEAPGVKVVGFAIATFINRKTGIAFPTYAKVVPRCAMTERGVRRGVHRLKEGGWLSVKKTRFKGPNEIRLALPSNVQSGTAVPNSSAQSGTAVPDSNAAQSGMDVPDNAAPSCRTNRHGDAAQSGTTVPVEPSIEPYTEPKTEPLRPSAFCNDAEVAKTNGNPFHLIASRVDALLSTKPSVENAVAKYVDGIKIPVTSGDHEKVESRQPGAYSCLLQITRSFMRSFGYELGDRAKIDGQYPDLAFVSLCPGNVLVEMVLRTRRRELTARDVALVATAAGLPRRAAP